MGTFPVPVISPLTVAQSDEPLVAPTVAIPRVDPEPADTDGQSDEGYSSSNQEAAPDLQPDEADEKPAPNNPDHRLNIFA